MAHLLEVNHVTKTYPGFTLEDLSFSLDAGFIMGFIGPNGSGKTTTIKAIMNLIRIDRGEIKVFGQDHIQAEKTIKERIGFVYDENHFYEDLSILEMKRIIAPFYRQWDDGLFAKYVSRFELPLRKTIKSLSRGMQMKFSLALALSHQADFIIMDEPTAGLDPVFRSELLDILYDLMQEEKKGILFSTHITSDLDRIADYITFIHQGKLVFSDSKDVILDAYAVVKGGKNILNADNRSLFTGIRENQFGFEALTNGKDAVRKAFRDQVVLERAALEDIMLYTVRGNHNV